MLGMRRFGCGCGWSLAGAVPADLGTDGGLGPISIIASPRGARALVKRGVTIDAAREAPMR